MTGNEKDKWAFKNGVGITDEQVKAAALERTWDRRDYPELESTLQMLSAAYSSGFSRNDYWPLLATLNQHMSHRQMANTLQLLGYAEYICVVDDWSGIDEILGSTKEAAIRSLEEKLRPFGYDDWAKEEELP